MTEQRLAKASWGTTNQVPYENIWSSGEESTVLNKFKYPRDWHKIIDLCNHYYRTDPIASTTINRILDVGFKGFYVHQGDCTDEEYKVYAHLNDMILLNLRELGLEFLISGLVIPEVIWGSKSGSQIDSSLPSDRVYEIPEVLWNRDPASMSLKKTPIPKRVNVFITLNDDDLYFIQNQGKYSDGTEDKETYELLKNEYPDFVRAVQKGETNFKLDNPFLIRRYPRKDTPYPTPYLLPALEPLEHKRNLRKMDYAVAARVISAILLITMGNDEYPLLEDQEDQILEVRKQMTFRSSANDIERLFMLFGNHTLALKWIIPEVDVLLDNSKYESINLDILFALGIPRIMLTGETSKTGTSTAEFALLSPAETIKATRNEILPWAEYLYDQIKERNQFENVPKPGFEEPKLYDISKLMTIADKLYERGAISKGTYARIGGFDFENIELPARVRELELIEELGIPESPVVPFSSPDIPGDNGKQNGEQDNDNEE